ncbi:hypothetical protein [Phyllobacterium zundukense]|uniref:Uncharacterized protein n=1 Tax=Phyllobacterium zundukense TaxID=1867719 RepID=A0ACD4CXN5_9HYPH|nr:hypothetical protein [Phyllobacterium zundukense]UXN58262.1 hypothetical protein N8E88_05495 [Phyllobacterium zundukense]
MRKPRDVTLVNSNPDGRPLIDRGGDCLLHLDVSQLSAEAAAAAIAKWLAN